MPKKAVTNENKYLTSEALRQTVAEAIARLELDRHQIKLAVLMHGEDVRVGQDETVDEAVTRIEAAIKSIETEYASVLNEEV